MPIRGISQIAAVAIVVLSLFGCAIPFVATTEKELEQRLIASYKAHLAAVAAGPVIEIKRPRSEVEDELNPSTRERIDRMSGPRAYEDAPLDLGPDLAGNEKSDTVGMTLRRAIDLVVKNNLVIHAAQLQPAITETQITQAEAAFDAVLFAQFDQEKLDTVRPNTGLAGLGAQQSSSQELTTGIRKLLSTGGQITAQTRFSRQFQDPSIFNVLEFYDADILVTLQQPLLRNFGSDVNRAQIELSQNARAEAIQDLRSTLIDAVFVVEQSYWDLVFARHRLLVQHRLLQRTIKDRDQIKARQAIDATPAQLTEANSFVGLRRAEVIRARQALRSASDAVKRLIYADDLPISGEIQIIPLDVPVDVPIEYSSLDAISTALRNRPEVQRRLLEIKDATIRQRVADNLRLPLLDLTATMEINGLGDDGRKLREAYDRVSEADFVDYIIALQFEVPIGNRGPEAQLRQRILERNQAVLNYQATARQAVVEVKDALRNVVTSYLLIGATRDGRLAAADNLRTLEDQEDAGAALTPEFIDLKLRRQEALANAESQEMQAMTDYMTAIAQYYRTLGTSLEMSGIEFNPQPTD